MRKYSRVFIFITLVTMLIYMPVVQTVKAETETAPPLKIMPFGDSITSSYSPFSSYRCYLDHSLHAANIPFIYSGSQTKDSYGNPPPPCGSPLADFDHRHEGYSGYATWNFLDKNDANYIDKILGRVIYGTSTPNIPDVVLMHLGTNDLGEGYSVSEIIPKLGLLIDHFRAKNPRVTIFIAQIIPCSALPATWCSKVSNLNAAIPGLAAQKNTLFSPVIAVDMNTGYDPFVDNDYHNNDYVHPNSLGDAIIAARWMGAIQTLQNRWIGQVYIPAVITEAAAGIS